LGIPCLYDQAAANVLIDEDGAELSFVCPAVRDAAMETGRAALLVRPLFAGDDAELDCVPVSL
jgi:hypothetical protein